MVARRANALPSTAAARGDVVIVKPNEPPIVTVRQFADDNDERLAPPDLRASLLRVLRMIWRWRMRSGLILLAFVMLGFLYSLLAPELYTSHATLIVGIRQPELMTADQARDVAKLEPDIDGALELMKSQPAMSFVADKLAAAGFEPFQSAPPADKPSMLARPRAVVDALLGRHPVKPPSNPMQQRYAELRKNFKLDRIGRSTLVDVSYTSQNPELSAVAANALANFSAQDKGALSGISLTEQGGFSIMRTFVVSNAPVPDQPASPNVPVILGISFIVGLGAAVTMSLLAEFRMQQRVLSTEELARRGIRSLGLFPTFSHKSGPSHVFDDAITSLQASLSSLPARHGPDGIVFLFTSAMPREGKSTTSAAFARAIAASGRKTLLVDADLRSPMLSRRYGLQGSPGLATCVRAGRTTNEAIRQDPQNPRLHFMAAGDDIEQPFETLASPCLRDLIDEWRTSYHVIIIDAPPVLNYGETRLLAFLSDYTVFLARWGETTWDSLNHGLRMLAESGGRVAGVAISRADLNRLSKFDYVDSQMYGRGASRAQPQPSSVIRESRSAAPVE